MAILKEWEIRGEVENFGGWLWLNTNGDWLQCCHVTTREDGSCQFASVPTLNKELIADLSWVCYQIEGGKKKGRLR